MRRDRIEPGSERSAVLKQPSLQVDLQERVLKHVVGKRRIAEVTGKIAVKLSLIAVDKLGEHSFIANVPIAAHEFLVRLLGEALCRIGPDGLNHFTYRRRRRFSTPSRRWVAYASSMFPGAICVFVRESLWGSSDEASESRS